jgi:hypothetical protein
MNELPRRVVAQADTAAGAAWVRLLSAHGFDPGVMRANTRRYVGRHRELLGSLLLAAVGPDSGCIHPEVIAAVRGWEDERLSAAAVVVLRRWLTTDVHPLKRDRRYVQRGGGSEPIWTSDSTSVRLQCDLHENQVRAAETLAAWGDTASLAAVAALATAARDWPCDRGLWLISGERLSERLEWAELSLLLKTLPVIRM